MKRLGIILLLTCGFLLQVKDVSAQRIIVKNLEKYDRQWIHFGFLLGYNKTNFRIERGARFYRNDSIYTVNAIGRAGFNLGIITNLRISNNFDLRFVPDLAFSQRDLSYKMIIPAGPTDVTLKKVESTFIEFPLELKFKSNRVNNYRFYVTGGFKYAIDLVSQEKVENEKDLIKLRKYDYGYIVGFGMDIYMPLFKFAPEIKMFQGIPNVLATDPGIYTTNLQSLKSRIFTLSLTFE
jgi:hypothetical protein